VENQSKFWYAFSYMSSPHIVDPRGCYFNPIFILTRYRNLTGWLHLSWNRRIMI